jgi:hypothetical protein
VVHFLDWHFVRPDLCKLDGIDFEAEAEVQEDDKKQFETTKTDVA